MKKPINIFILLLTGIILLSALLYFFRDSTDSESVLVTATEQSSFECPAWQNYMDVFGDWSDTFKTNNPTASDDTFGLAWKNTLESNSCILELPACPPDTDNFDSYWNSWSANYIIHNPTSDTEAQMADWNYFMTANGCGSEWQNPFEQTLCPTRGNFAEVWNTWSETFLAENPSAGHEDQKREWADLMIGIGCPDWADPSSNTTSVHSTTKPKGSTTEYYQVQLPE